MADLFSPGEIAQVVGNIKAGELTLDQALTLFETVYMPSRNFSPKTRVSYKTDLTQLVSFLKSCGISRVEEVGLSHLHSFLADLDAKGLTGVSRGRKVASVRVLFAFLHKDGLIARNPTRELIPPKREEKDPRYLTYHYDADGNLCSNGAACDQGTQQYQFNAAGQLSRVLDTDHNLDMSYFYNGLGVRYRQVGNVNGTIIQTDTVNDMLGSLPQVLQEITSYPDQYTPNSCSESAQQSPCDETISHPQNIPSVDMRYMVAGSMILGQDVGATTGSGATTPMMRSARCGRSRLEPIILASPIPRHTIM